MNASATAHAESSRPASPGIFQRIRRSRFFFISVAAHLVFLLIAALVVVQTISAKRKLTFTSAPPSPNPSQRALEHKVQMAKKQNTMSAPVQPKRITTTGLAKVALPDMPALPSADLVPNKMAGMTGAGFGPGAASATGASGGTGGPVPFFGLRRAGAGLAGTFYDLKQTRDGKPSEMTPAPHEKDGWSGIKEPTNLMYDNVLMGLIGSGMNESSLSKYFRGSEPLFTTQIYIPTMDANNGPRAFNLADKVQPKRWIVVYSGKVTPSESGTYRFVGWADDILIVRFDNRVVLDGTLMNLTKHSRKKTLRLDGLNLDVPEGETIQVNAGIPYNMEVVIGERPGGNFSAFLLIEKVDGDIAKTSESKLPLFKLAQGPPPEHGAGVPFLAPDAKWSVWGAQPRQSLLGVH